MGMYEGLGNTANYRQVGSYRLSARQARKIGLPWMAQVKVSVDYMSDDDKAAMGIASGVVMAKNIIHRGEVVATNVPLRGVPEARHKPI